MAQQMFALPYSVSPAVDSLLLVLSFPPCEVDVSSLTSPFGGSHWNMYPEIPQWTPASPIWDRRGINGGFLFASVVLSRIYRRGKQTLREKLKWKHAGVLENKSSDLCA